MCVCARTCAWCVCVRACACACACACICVCMHDCVCMCMTISIMWFWHTFIWVEWWRKCIHGLLVSHSLYVDWQQQPRFWCTSSLSVSSMQTSQPQVVSLLSISLAIYPCMHMCLCVACVIQPSLLTTFVKFQSQLQVCKRCADQYQLENWVFMIGFLKSWHQDSASSHLPPQSIDIKNVFTLILLNHICVGSNLTETIENIFPDFHVCAKNSRDGLFHQLFSWPQLLATRTWGHVCPTKASRLFPGAAMPPFEDLAFVCLQK